MSVYIVSSNIQSIVGQVWLFDEHQPLTNNVGMCHVSVAHVDSHLFNADICLL